MKYDLEKRIFLLEKYIKFEQISSVQHAYRSKFKNEPAPGHNTIMGIVSAFKTTGSVLPKPPIKKQPCEKREEAKHQLKDMVAWFGHIFEPKSILRPRNLANTCLIDFARRSASQTLQTSQVAQARGSWLRKTSGICHLVLVSGRPSQVFFYFSDEAYFYLTQPINSQNNRIWAEDQPLEGAWKCRYTTRKF